MKNLTLVGLVFFAILASVNSQASVSGLEDVRKIHCSFSSNDETFDIEISNIDLVNKACKLEVEESSGSKYSAAFKITTNFTGNPEFIQASDILLTAEENENSGIILNSTLDEGRMFDSSMDTLADAVKGTCLVTRTRNK